MTAVVPEPGTPSVRSGANAPVQAAPLAVSGATSPRSDPLPKRSRSAAGASARSIE